jgi:metal-responsive CopG/Arc/MetJ family transcriptional regulator
MASRETQKLSLPEGLMAEVEETAKAERRTVLDVLCEAVRRYLDDRKWQKLVDAGGRRAKSKGLTEADVPRLVEEVRRENRTRER